MRVEQRSLTHVPRSIPSRLLAPESPNATWIARTARDVATIAGTAVPLNAEKCGTAGMTRTPSRGELIICTRPVGPAVQGEPPTLLTREPLQHDHLSEVLRDPRICTVI